MRFALTAYLLLGLSAAVYARPLTRTDFNGLNVVDPVSHLDPRTLNNGVSKSVRFASPLETIPTVKLTITFTGEAAGVAADGKTLPVPPLVQERINSGVLRVPGRVTARLESWGKSSFNARTAEITYEAGENNKGNEWMLESSFDAFVWRVGFVGV
ncbi:hypothetical protein EV360DRAFT_87383 [Lentinula raphanica]|nr:hypothetical protein EV360DRAFT_87383 [Lentinula raphanica]